MSATYTRLEWDKTGEKAYEAGVDRVVVYPMNDDGTYENGAAWNGVFNVTENPDGAEINKFYANNGVYASLVSVENPKGSIGAYTYPDKFAECDGSKELVAGSGVFARQQKRRPFGMTYRNFVGNDGKGADDPNADYILHILYALTVSPTERSHDTINEDPELEELSWDFEGIPAKLTRTTGFKPMGSIEIDSRTITSDKLTAIENLLYGVTTVAAGDNVEAVAGNAATLPTPDQIYDILTAV